MCVLFEIFTHIRGSKQIKMSEQQGYYISIYSKAHFNPFVTNVPLMSEKFEIINWCRINSKLQAL